VEEEEEEDGTHTHSPHSAPDSAHVFTQASIQRVEGSLARQLAPAVATTGEFWCFYCRFVSTPSVHSMHADRDTHAQKDTTHMALYHMMEEEGVLLTAYNE
jgi:hypothetical protein